MDILTSTQLTKLIKQITETGEWDLDKDSLKSIKNICKRSDANVDIAFDYWFAQLKKEHAQIRYSCVQLAEQLFQRSHRFRQLLADDFPQFVTLTVGGRQKGLPPPHNVAIKLKEYTLALIKAWNAKFANKYRPVAIAYDHLEYNGILRDNQPSLDSIHSQNQDRANRRTRMQPVFERRLEQISCDSEEYLPIIYENLQQMEGCFEILIPKFDNRSEVDFDALMKGDIDFSKAMTDDENTYKEELRSHGLGSNRYKLEIVISKNPVADEVHESKENKVVYEQLREGYKVARDKHIKQLTEWVNSLGRMELSASNDVRNALLKKLLDVKADVAEITRKAELLGIQVPSIEEQKSDDDDDDDDDEYLNELFEEVDVPSSSSSTSKRQRKPKLPPARRIFPLAFERGMEDDATYNRARTLPEVKTLETKQQGESRPSKDKGKGKATVASDTKEELLKRAPVVEWGEDLYYWDKNDVQFNTSGIERSHRFMGVGEGTNEIPDHLLEQLRKRTVYYKSQMPQELKACRAPLRSGKLCPRRDLVICPFHGKIIPRDEYGIPAEIEDAVSSSPTSDATSQEQQTKKDDITAPVNNINKDTSNLWQELERDVMKQVDQPLIELDKKRKGKRKKPQSNLVDVRKKKETSFTRLQKKVDDPSTRRNLEDSEDYERSIKSRDQQMNMW